jgi:hypothetical protein
MAGIGVYPGSFNPPTIAHLAIARAARDLAQLTRVDLAVSHVALGKGEPDYPTFADRVAVLRAVVDARPWLGLVIADAQLIADIALGYDAVVLGADKWAQVIDPLWYGGSGTARDAAVARLPRVLVAPRPPLFPSPGQSTERFDLLDLADEHVTVSSTGARSGHREWMAPEAAAFDAETGAWTDPERYARRLAGKPVDR